MAFGSTQLTHHPVDAQMPGLWQAAADMVRRWHAGRRQKRRERHLAGSPLSTEWLRQHEIEAAKHRDTL